MEYLKCNKKNNNGFSIIEIIIVLGIFAIFFTISSSVYTNFKQSSNLKIATDSFVQAIRYAKTNSQMVKGDSRWGVKIVSPGLTIFKGDSYISRDTTADQSFNFPAGITSSGITEFVFEKMTGTITNTGDVFISDSFRDQKLTLNSYGIISYANSVSNNTNGCIGTIWGDVENGYSNNAYLSSSVNYPDSCIFESRTCTNGIFSGTYTNTACIVANNPVSKWVFEEGSGCVANDLYGSNNGALKNDCPIISPSWVAGKIGGALSFNGFSNNVTVNNSVNLNFTTSMSVSAWIKWNINPSTGAPYAGIVNKNADNQYRLQHNGTNSKFEFGIRTSTGSTYVTSTTTPVVDNWYHLFGTWDGSLVKIYVNGVLEQTGTRSGNILSSTSPLKIGSSSLDARWFNGIIDEVIVWDRALTQEEVVQVYSSNL